MADYGQGYKYQLSVTAYLASLLSKDETVQYYYIFYEIQEVEPFDDIVLVVQYNDSEAFRLYFVQVKSGKVKLDVNAYLNAYKRIMENKPWECLKHRVREISEDDIQFWYFACKKFPPQPIPFREGKLEIRKRERNDEKLIIKKKNVHELLSEDEAITRKYQDFFKDFYVFPDQDDTDTIAIKLKGMWALNDPSPIIDYFDKYFIKNKRVSLSRANFEHELLRIRLWDSIVKPTKTVPYQKESAVAWIDLTLSHNATIVKNELNIECGLFSCILRKIYGIITVEQWNTCVNNDGKLTKEVKSKFTSKSHKPETLKDLLVYLWRCRKIPLVLKSDNSLPQLKDFLNLNQHYIIIDSNPDRRFDEMKRYSLTALKDLGVTRAERLLQSVLVSMQGRQPTSLYKIINGNKSLMQTLTCSDILKLMEPKQVYLSKDCLEAYNYTLFLIETAQPELSDYEDDLDGDSVRIYCHFNQSNEIYEEVKWNVTFKNYKIYSLRLQNDKLKLIRRFNENKLDEGFQGLNSFQIDQYGNSVYIMNEDHAVPIIGKVTRMSCSQYLRRHLRKESVHKKRYGSNETTDSTIKFSETVFSDKDFFEEMDGKICVVVGEAGIGKTTFLQALAQTCDPQYYSLFCNLAQFQVDMRGNFQRLLKDPLSFLWSKQGPILYDHFLNSLRKKQKRLIILLDSFDEVISTCKEQVLELIRKLNEEACIDKIIIGSRLLTVQLLTDQFATIKVIKIETFSNEHNGHYIRNWNLDEDSLRGMPAEFVKNPLYLDMLRKIYQNSEINFQTLSGWSLYNRIVDSEIERYSRRIKHNIDDFERKHILRFHWRLALKSIFGNNHITQKLAQEGQAKFTNATRLGMIKWYDENEDPVFVHHTFAEFFAVHWLIETTDKEDAKYIYKLMVEERRHNILDIHSEEFPLHKAILEVDDWNVEMSEQIEKLYADDKEILLQTDGIGRTVLHIIGTRYSHHMDKCLETIIRYMRKEGYNLYSRDNLLNWTWIEYCEHFSESFITKVFPKFVATHETYWHYYTSLPSTNHISNSVAFDSYKIAVEDFLPSILADLLFVRYFENEDFIRFRNLCLSSEVMIGKLPKYFELDELELTPLHLAVIYSNVNVVRACIKRGDKVHAVDRFGCTPLYHSVLKQNSEIVKLLLKKGRNKLKKKVLKPLFGFSTFQLSLMIGNKDITKMLIEGMGIKKFGFDWLCDAVEYGDTEVITLLLEAKINPNIKSSKYAYAYARFNTEIHYRNALRALKTCCDYNSDVNRMPLDEYLSIATALNEISLYGCLYPDLVSYFPFSKAVDTRRIDIIHLLLKTGINVDQEIEYYHRDTKKLYLHITPLCYAVESWNIDMVELLLQHGANVNYAKRNKQLPLIRAICQNEVIHNNDYDIYNGYLGMEGIFRKRLYYEHRIDVSRIISRLDSSLSKRAFLERRIQIVKVLLRYGADVNFTVENGLSPLEEALNTRKWMIVEILLLYGANPNNLKEWYFTDILAVLPAENIRIIELLLENGADPNFETACGITPLYVIARRRHPDMVRILFEYGANADIITCTRTLLATAKQDGRIDDVTLLWNLSEMCFVGPIYDPAYPAVVLTLLQTVTNQESINLANEIDITRDGNDVKFINELVQYASDFRNPNTMKYLNVVLELNKPEIDQILLKNIRYLECRDNLVFIAVEYRNKTMIEILTRNGQDVNTMDEYGDTPLVSAITMSMNKSRVEFLLENGADVNLANFHGQIPLICAVNRQNIDIIEVLLKYNATVNYVKKGGFTPLLYAIDNNNANIVRILLDYGADVNFTDESAFTLLYAAVMKGNPEIIKVLLRYGAQSNIETCGNTLLYKEIKSRHRDIVRLLLSGKYSPILGNYEVIQKIYRNVANANAVYEFGLTPLHLATQAGDDGIVETLLDFNAKCDQVDEHGRTALHYAVEMENEYIVKLLLRTKADVNIKDVKGLTPLDYAKRRGNSEIIDKLSFK